MENFRVLHLVVHNFKGIELIDITPDEHLVKVQGKNDACKTALINSVMVALTGTRGYTDLVKRDADKSIIEVDFGEFIVKRVITPDRTSVQVLAKTMGKQVPIPSPAEFLADKVNSLALNPLSFTVKAPKDQVAELLSAFKVDISDLEMDYVAADGKRKQVKDEVRTLEKKIALTLNLDLIAETNGVAIRKSDSFMEKWDTLVAANVPELLLSTEPSVAEALAQLEELNRKHGVANGMLQELNSIHSQTTAFKVSIAELENKKGAAVEQHQKRKDRVIAEIARLQAELAELEATDVIAPIEADIAEKNEQLSELTTREQELVAIDIPDKIVKIKAKISETQAVIASASDFQRKNDQITQMRKEVDYIKNQKEEIASLTEEMDANKAEQRARLTAANIPIDGLEITPEGIMINGALFQNLSESVRIKTALQIVKAKDPAIKVITIEAGSGIDESNMKLLMDFAREGGYQIWIEQVREVPTPGEGFYLEAGAVLSDEEKKERLRSLL